MKCPKCHSENSDTARFCSNCAAALGGTEDSPPIVFTETLRTSPTELVAGSLFAGRYQVIEELGKGGMGKVYRVLDTKLNEEVALKLIKPEISSDRKTLERFKNELKLARKVSQKNVGRMFDMGEETGTHYITMEYVPGEDLKSSIRRFGRLPVGKSVAIANQICEGLSVAHKIGIIHRDLKPSNIMIDKEGNVRIMDFGIARSTKDKGITGEGVIIGTPEYMSPEQVEGKEADQRSDIYSLGIILYEMVTGAPPFEGDTPFAVGVKHKNDIPQDPRKINPQIPDDLGRIILQCLEKEKNKRPQTADDMLSSLGEIESGISMTERAAVTKRPRTSKELTVTLGIKKPYLAGAIVLAVIAAAILIWKVLPRKEAVRSSIAVISFENQTGESSYDYLQKAIPNLLITSLERSNNVEVMTWERMHDLLEQMGKPEVEVIDRDLGYELCRREGVQAIVLGSFVMAGDMFATDVKVLDVTTKRLLKSASSRGEGISSILKSQIDELSREISKGIGIPAGTSGQKGQSIATVTTESMEAYQHYLKGKESFDKFYFDEAERHFEKALELDPRFAMAHFMLGQIYLQRSERDAAIEAYTQAKAFFDRATEKEKLYIESECANWLERDSGKRLQLLQELARKYPKEKEVHQDLGNIYQSREMYNEALESYLKAFELDPNWGYVLNSLGYTYSDMGDYEKAIEFFERYASLSPGDANPVDSMAEQYFRMGRLDEAIAKYEEALEIRPDFDSGLRLAIVYAFREEYAQAQAQLDRFIARVSSPGRKAEGYLWRGIFSFLAGKREDAFGFLAELETFADRIRTGSAYYTKGWMLFDLGEFDASRTHLQRALDLFLSFRPNSIGTKSWAEFCIGLVDVREGKLGSAESRLETIKTLSGKLATPSSIKDNSFRKDWLQAEILMAQGSAKEAVAILENTVSESAPLLHTDNYGPYNMPFRRDVLARAYHQCGRLDEAIAEYERLTRLVPEEKDWHLVHPIYYFLLAKLYEEKKMTAEALECYNRFLSLWKDADPGTAEVETAKERVAALNK
jgi:serine/threonine protein kinase/Flp pilus assembly protein TadD